VAIAYYVDDDIGMKPTLAGLHRLGIEVDPCDAFGMRGAEDGQHLAFAHAIGRTLVTANRRDFARIHGEWMASGETHSGIILADQRTSIGIRFGVSRGSTRNAQPTSS
jgi:hypothetical protein